MYKQRVAAADFFWCKETYSNYFGSWKKDTKKEHLKAGGTFDTIQCICDEAVT